MLLKVRNLRTHFFTPGSVVRAVDGASLAVAQGQTVALVGESGCGKSVTALSILRLVPEPGRIVSGSVGFDGHELLALSEREMRAVRGDRIAMVFQEPMSSLNPVLTIGEQISEAIRVHRRVASRAARERSLELLARVRLPTPEQLIRGYPHELSGGMQQRVMIALALACEPALLIADEPTTALDVTLQAQILALLRALRAQTGVALLLITHDLGLVAQLADWVYIMYAGRVVEHAPADRLLADPRHPYTQGLLRCQPGTSTPRARLPTISGEPPDLLKRFVGCPFCPRCDAGRDDAGCHAVEPLLADVAPNHAVACWHAPGYTFRHENARFSTG